MTRIDPVVRIGSIGRVRRRAWLLVGAAGGGVVLMMGCAGAPKVASVSGSIQAAADLNPSVSQRPSPLTVRVYELRSAVGFNQADFMSLFQAEQATLGAEVLGREEFILQPGESRPYNKQLNAETRFIGVFAAYRNLERARWRAVVAVAPGRAQKLAIRAESLAISALVQP